MEGGSEGRRRDRDRDRETHLLLEHLQASSRQAVTFLCWITFFYSSQTPPSNSDCSNHRVGKILSLLNVRQSQESGKHETPFCSNRISVAISGMGDVSPLRSCKGGSIFGLQSVSAVMRKSGPEEHRNQLRAPVISRKGTRKALNMCQMEEKI